MQTGLLFSFQDNSKWTFMMDEQLMSWATSRPEVSLCVPERVWGLADMWKCVLRHPDLSSSLSFVSVSIVPVFSIVLSGWFLSLFKCFYSFSFYKLPNTNHTSQRYTKPDSTLHKLLSSLFKAYLCAYFTFTAC